jgi:hypothetical protein
MKFSGQAARILDFDSEARPLSWYGGDFVTKELTAIAAKFIGEDKMHVWVLGPDKTEDMLAGFVKLYNQADIVTGHFIRGYDLPVVNGALVEHDMEPLHDKMSHDTKLDLIKFSGLSKSQENLGAMLGLVHPKVQMDQAKWRAANRLTRAGIRLTKQRVCGDVEQHIEMRQRLLDMGLLGPPKVWRSTSSGMGNYHA